MNIGIIIILEIIILGSLSYFYYKYLKNKEIIEVFPRFFQEIYNNTSSGRGIVESVRESKDADYGKLTYLVRNMCLQIEWGVPFYVALRNFGNKINNKFIDKIITLTEKTSEFSPNIGKSIKEINDYISLSRRLELKRKTELFPQLLSFYLVFFVFLLIILVVFNLFVPSLGASNIGAQKSIFGHLIMIEAVLTGLAIGKITENSFIAGLKHLIILSSFSIILLYLL